MSNIASGKLTRTILAVVGAVALLAAGAVAGYALNDSSGDGGGDSRLYIPPANATGQGDGDDAAGANGVETAADTPESMGEAAADEPRISMPGYPGGCPVPAAGVSAGGSAIDLSGAGFDMHLPGDGFQLLSVTARGHAECDKDGEPTGQSLAVDSQWEHAESGYQVYLSQRQAAEAQPNVRYASSIDFWVGGYQYTANVMNSPVMPLAAEQSEPPPPAEDPQVQAILDMLVGQLAPDLGTQCFYTEREGTWADLAALGIGDPRNAIPAGYSEQHINVSAFEAPAEGCSGVELGIVPSSGFNAYFESADGWIEVGAWPVYEQEDGFTGRLNSQGASWSDGTWHYNVHASNREGGLGADVVSSIASALDPAFDTTCLVQDSALEPGQLAGHGFNLPAGPAGYTVEVNQLTVSDVPAECADAPEGYPTYNLSWLISNDDTTFEVSVNRFPAEDGIDGEEPGYISDYGMFWTDGQGTHYSIHASSRGVSATPDRDAMVAIAQSLEPSLDPSTLSEEPVGRPEPLPADGGDDAIDSDGAAESGAPSSSGVAEPERAE
ncbi:MAG: hypothetical protein U5Q44_13920 [Dehalococcoidia bacterium]|nr:hypothetical protein [Dehalococcoidia bacterium]